MRIEKKNASSLQVKIPGNNTGPEISYRRVYCVYRCAGVDSTTRTTTNLMYIIFLFLFTVSLFLEGVLYNPGGNVVVCIVAGKEERSGASSHSNHMTSFLRDLWQLIFFSLFFFSFIFFGEFFDFFSNFEGSFERFFEIFSAHPPGKKKKKLFSP